MKDKYKNDIENIEKEKNDFSKNKYVDHIKLGEIIFNTYLIHKGNYFNVKNLYNLMKIYYNNNEIYNSVVLNFINNSKNNESLLKLIENKKIKSERNNQQNLIKQNIYNNQKKLNSIKIDFPVPPLIGLENVGDICYMNAILQCLSQIEKLTNYFKYTHRVNDIIEEYKLKKKLCLTESYKVIIENLWPSNYEYIIPKYNHKNSNNAYFSPFDFKEKISEMNPLFKGIDSNDAKDLINFILWYFMKN